MEGYELRSEVFAGGNKYYIQSNVVLAQQAVVTSMFHEGSLLSKQRERYDATLSDDGIRSLVRRIHENQRVRINALLEIRDSLKTDTDARAHMKLGEALYRQKLFRESMAEVIRAIKLGLDNSDCYSVLGNCLLAVGDTNKALKSFQKGADMSPEYPDMHNDLGRAYLALERCREAASAFERAIELNKYYQDAFLNLGIALAMNVVLKQDYEMSRDLRSRMSRVLQMNLQLRPSLDTEAFRAAVAAAEREEYEVVYERLTAIRAEQESISQSDLSLELYLIMRFRSDNLTEDEIDLHIDRVRRALDENPGYADLQNDLGVLFAAKCKIYIDKAHGAFRDALAINSGFKKAQKNLKLAANDRQGIHFLLKALLD